MKRFHLLLLLIFAPITQADVLSRNLTVNSNKITILDNYSPEKQFGTMNVKLCSSCPVKTLTITDTSIFILDGKNQPAEKILETRLTQPSKAVRIQYNHEDNSVTYIRWNPVAEF
jgi:hypothetical protein